MEGLLTLVGVAVGVALAIVPFVLPIVAYRRTRKIPDLEARLGRIEDELLFALLFLASGARDKSGAPRPRLWWVTQAAAIILPHAFALYFALDARLGHHLYPVALLLVLLEIAALYLAASTPPDEEGHSFSYLPAATAAGSLAVVASWLASTDLDAALAWEGAAIAVGLCVPAVVVQVREQRARAERSVVLDASLVYPAGMFVVLLVSMLGDRFADPLPHLAGLSLITALLLVTAVARWPFVLARDVDPLIVPLTAPTAAKHGDATRYALTLPVTPLPIAQLLLDVKEGFFDRSLRLVLFDEAGRERERGAAPIARAVGTHATLELDAGQERVSGLAFDIVDGGDAPLTFTGARLKVPSAALLLAARAGRYALVVGNPEQEAASYELRALDALLDQLDAAEVKAEVLVDNPAFSRAARLRAGGAPERLMVWIALGLAVLVLGGLTLRMARAERDGADAWARA